MDDILLDIQDLSHRFRLSLHTAADALCDVSLQLSRGEIFGLVGESGSGKSTLARCAMNIIKPSSGSIRLNGIDILDPKQRRQNRRTLSAARQLIFQDSDSSLNPRMKVLDILAEPLRIARTAPPRHALRPQMALALERVGLEAAYLDRCPPELSGGQRQRVAIARALLMQPALLIADEPIAALDVSIQAQIVNLFRALQRENGFTLLFIAHDLAMVEFLCDRVGVLCRGRLVEVAPTKALFQNPLHSYTKALLDSIPIPDPRLERARNIAPYRDAPLPGGALREAAPGHFVLLEEGFDAL